MKRITVYHITTDKTEKVNFDVPDYADNDVIWDAARVAMEDAHGHKNVTCWKEEQK